MTIGAGIAIAGAFIGTSLAFAFGTDVQGAIFFAPTIAAVCVAIFG